MQRYINQAYITHLHERILFVMENEALHQNHHRDAPSIFCEDCQRFWGILTGLFDLLKIEESLIVITSNLLMKERSL
jgi:histidinol phosphatase-like PHP family hydrolase